MEKHCRMIVFEDKEVPSVEQILREVARFSGQFSEGGNEVFLATSLLFPGVK